MPKCINCGFEIEENEDYTEFKDGPVCRECRYEYVEQYMEKGKFLRNFLADFEEIHFQYLRYKLLNAYLTQYYKGNHAIMVEELSNFLKSTEVNLSYTNREDIDTTYDILDYLKGTRFYDDYYCYLLDKLEEH